MNLNFFLCRWSGGRDDKYFARMGKNVLSVYETENFSLVDKKSIKVENIMDFSWSPTDPIISLFVPESGGGNQPARVNFCFPSFLWPCHGLNFFFLLNSFYLMVYIYLCLF
jgi:uncharacterized protein with WD repeat